MKCPLHLTVFQFKNKELKMDLPSLYFKKF